MSKTPGNYTISKARKLGKGMTGYYLFTITAEAHGHTYTARRELTDIDIQRAGGPTEDSIRASLLEEVGRAIEEDEQRLSGQNRIL